MPDVSSLALTGAKVEAVAGKARLANSVLHLFKFGFNPTITSVLADFLAQECDFASYAAKTIVAWSDPVLAGEAYVVYAPTQTFPWATAPGDVGNQVGGSFLVLSTGELYQYTVFDPARPCMGPDQAIITTVSDVFPAG